MDRQIAQKFSQELNIEPTQIAREEWELIILGGLFESELGTNIVFRGGTALRLAYNSPRFSEDLDFSILKDTSPNKFQNIIQRITDRFSQIKITDLASKYYTHLAELRIKEDWLNDAFHIKIEVSRRKDYKKGAGYELILLASPVTNVQTLGNVSTLEQIFKEKLAAIQSRKLGRDLFDLWFISQKLKKDVDFSKYNFTKKQLKYELSRFLPKNYWDFFEKLGR